MRVPCIPELASSLPLSAVALLALNDHVLKRTVPGAVTGKLSDLAGCFVLPLFVSASLALVTRWRPGARLAAGAAATVALFASIKLSAPAADAVAGALARLWAPLGGGAARIVADPTDLVALPMVAAGWAFGRRACRRASEEER